MARRRGRPPKSQYIYKDADRFFEINNDPDLEPVRISLPEPPPYYLIDGYGLPPDEQFFKPVQVPDKLQDVERRSRRKLKQWEDRNKNHKATSPKLIKMFWESFDEARDNNYDDMVEWLKEIHWHRIHGYWFFNDGKPTYITGSHFDYLNFWSFPDEKSRNEGRPEYRDIDRKVYLFRKYAEETHERVWINDKAEVQVEDVGERVCYGTVEPKSRRCGITTQALHTGMHVAMTGIGKYFTVISMEGDNAEKHYVKKLLPAFRSYPLWLKPMHTSQITNRIMFIDDNILDGGQGLNGYVDYTDSAGVRKNDGDKLHYGLMDEEGKTERGDINERWNVNKEAMALGDRIIGFSIHPTTVEEMDVGGKEYMVMCEGSRFYERDSNGFTSTGLFEIFVPAYERFEGWVDRFGMSVVNAPTDRQKKLKPNSGFARTGVGAKEYLQNRLDIYLEKGTPEAMEKHRSLRRKFPMRYSDCWIGSSGDLGFDMDVIDSRLADLRKKKRVRHGRLEWSNGFGSDVKFVDDIEGPFEMSMLLTHELTNRRVKNESYDPITGEWKMHWEPQEKYKFTASADAFKAGTSNDAKKMGTHTRQSDGGLAVLWEFDGDKDGEVEREPSRWESHKFVCSYRYRPPSLDDYKEDALKMCIYFGAMMYPERNVGDVDDYFIRMGYGGYLLYDLDPTTGKRAEKAGFASYERKKTELFLCIKDYIYFHGHKEDHASFLEEVKSIQGVEQMNKYDRFTAHGGCLLGSKQTVHNRLRAKSSEVSDDIIGDVKSFWDQNFPL